MATVTWLVFACMVAAMFVLAYRGPPSHSARVGPNAVVFDSTREMR